MKPNNARMWILTQNGLSSVPVRVLKLKHAQQAHCNTCAVRAGASVPLLGLQKGEKRRVPWWAVEMR